MTRKRASLKGKGEEILGVKRGGQGVDILFGTGNVAESAPTPKDDGTAPVITPAAGRGLPEGEADLDEEFDLDELLSVEAEAAESEVTMPAVTAYPAGEEGLLEGEADLGEEVDLGDLLSAEAEAAEGAAALPELATTPAAPAPPSPPPPAMERPIPVPPPVVEWPMPVSPPVVERPLPAPPPVAPSVPAPEPVKHLPAPPAPTPAVAPPSTATGAPDLSAPRKPRTISVVDEDFDLLAEEISADAVAAAMVGAPEGVRLTAEQRARLLRRPSVKEKLTELERAIEGQYDRILRENVSVNKSVTDWCHNLLAEARSIVLNRQVEKLAKAEWNVEQVRARLDRAGESRKQANRFAWPLVVWGVFWFGLFVYLIFNPTVILRLLSFSDANDAFLVPQIFLRSLFFGGIGGVAAVFYHLFKYVRERSFDSQYLLSYVGKPFMGMILGSMIYLTIFVMMRVMGLAPIGFETGGTETVTDVMYTALLFFVAMAAGFKENLAFDLLNRVIKAVLGKEEEKEEVPAPPPAAAATS